MFAETVAEVAAIVRLCAAHQTPEAIATVVAAIQCDVPMARIELLDEVQVRAINRYLAGRVAETGGGVATMDISKCCRVPRPTNTG